MQVGAHHRALHCALGAAASGQLGEIHTGCNPRVFLANHRARIADAANHRSQLPGISAQGGAAHVVFKAGEWLLQKLAGGGSGDLTNSALRQRLGDRIHHTQSGDFLATGAETGAENLEPGTNRQNLFAGLGCGLNATVGNEMLRSNCLGDVFATAYGIDIQAAGHCVAKLDWHNVGVDAPAAGALTQHQGVAVVAVSAQYIGQDQADG